MKKFFFLTLIISVLAIFFVYRGYSTSLHYALNPTGEDRITLSIPEGSTGNDIAQLLYEKNLIDNVSAFNFYLRQNKLSNQLKAGRFVFQENFDLPKIVDVLVSGKSSVIKPWGRRIRLMKTKILKQKTRNRIFSEKTSS